MNSCNLKRTHLLYLALSYICSLWRCFGIIFTCSNCTMMGRRPGLIIKSPSKIRFEGSITGGYRRILPLIRRRRSELYRKNVEKILSFHEISLSPFEIFLSPTYNISFLEYIHFNDFSVMLYNLSYKNFI